MLKVSDKNLKPIGILENAFDVGVDIKANELNRLSFSLPSTDPKNELCKHFNFIDVYGPSGRYYGKYRIMPINTSKSADNDVISYECEHVLATLLDSVMLDYYQFTNLTTGDVIASILEVQDEKHWELGRCDFDRRFHYSFENENGLLAPLLSIPQPFNEPYLFTFDTETYPWKINLIRPSDDLTWDIWWGRDMISFDEVSDPTKIVNRIYPKGAGEGVNQLTIEEINNGIKYVEDTESIENWGLKQCIWTDRRFENVENLKASAESLITQWKDPNISFTIAAADLSIKEEYKHLEKPFYTVGQINVDDSKYQARIVGMNIPNLAEEWNVNYKIANKTDDIATTITDVERKQQVNEAYSQGATNILNFGYQDNADENIPALIPFYIDDDVVNVNTVELTFRTKPFRAYSRATAGGGAVVTSTASGGGRSVTSSSGGGRSVTSSSGGGTSTSTQSGGGTTTTTSTPSSWDSSVIFTQTTNSTDYSNHIHPIPSARLVHTHQFTLQSHSHNFTVPNHTHAVDIPNHTHEITLPNHTHDILHGIYELETLPNNVQIRVDGNLINFSDIKGDRINLVDYMEKDDEGKIKRGRHEVTILPDGRARIEADLILRVFIQSRLGGVF